MVSNQIPADSFRNIIFVSTGTQMSLGLLIQY